MALRGEGQRRLQPLAPHEGHVLPKKWAAPHAAWRPIVLARRHRPRPPLSAYAARRHRHFGPAASMPRGDSSAWAPPCRWTPGCGAALSRRTVGATTCGFVAAGTHMALQTKGAHPVEHRPFPHSTPRRRARVLQACTAAVTTPVSPGGIAKIGRGRHDSAASELFACGPTTLGPPCCADGAARVGPTRARRLGAPVPVLIGTATSQPPTMATPCGRVVGEPTSPRHGVSACSCAERARVRAVCAARDPGPGPHPGSGRALTARRCLRPPGLSMLGEGTATSGPLQSGSTHTLQ